MQWNLKKGTHRGVFHIENIAKDIKNQVLWILNTSAFNGYHHRIIVILLDLFIVIVSVIVIVTVTFRITDYVPVPFNCSENCTFVERIRMKDSIDDASAGMAIVILLFVVPKTFSLQGSKAGLLKYFIIKVSL